MILCWEDVDSRIAWSILFQNDYNDDDNFYNNSDDNDNDNNDTTHPLLWPLAAISSSLS